MWKSCNEEEEEKEGGGSKRKYHAQEQDEIAESVSPVNRKLKKLEAGKIEVHELRL